MSGKGFGLKKALNLGNFNQTNAKETKIEFYKNLVFGEHFLIPKLLFILDQQNEDTLFLSNHLNFNKSLVLSEMDQYFYYPRFDEANFEENFEAIKDLLLKFDLGINESHEEIKFYKDGKFHRFNTRVKSSALMEGEESFLHPRSFINISKIYDESQIEKMDEIIQKFHDFQIISKIECKNPTDLIQKANYRITFSNDHIIESENLYWFDSPLKLEKLLIDNHERAYNLKSVLSDNYALSTLQVNFLIDQKFDEKHFTYFIPQSMMHEQGHYIVCSSNTDNDLTKSRVNAYLHLNQEEEFSEEDVAKRIRHFKSTLKRVLPDIYAKIQTEEILFAKDKLFKKSHFKENMGKLRNEDLNFFVFFEEGNLIQLLNEFNLIIEKYNINFNENLNLKNSDISSEALNESI